MALTATHRKMSGIAHRASGYLSGTYTAATVEHDADDVVIADGVMTITLGFVPKFFEIKNITDRLVQTWYEGMNTGDFLEEVAAGDKTLQTDDQIVVDTDARTVTVTFGGGAATDNDTVVWVAEG